MHMGTPALVSERSVCQRDLVTEGETGWVFKADEPPSLETKLAGALAALADPATRRRLRENVTARIAGILTCKLRRAFSRRSRAFRHFAKSRVTRDASLPDKNHHCHRILSAGTAHAGRFRRRKSGIGSHRSLPRPDTKSLSFRGRGQDCRHARRLTASPTAARWANHTRWLLLNLLLDFWWGLRVAFALPAGDVVICNTVTLPVWLRRVKPSAGTRGRGARPHAERPRPGLRPRRSSAFAQRGGDRKTETGNPRLAGRIVPFPYPIDWNYTLTPPPN